MLLTEQQARERWCPYARVHVPAGVINRVSAMLKRMAAKMRSEGRDLRDAEFIEEQQQDCNCIAAECMAWRWEEDIDRLREVDEGPRGYCGAFGRPEGAPL